MFYASTDWTENAFASLPVNLDVGQIGTEEIIKHYDNINLRLYRLECWKMKNENPEEWYGTHPSDPDARRNNFTFPGLHSQQESNQKEDTRKPEARVNFDAIARCELLDPSSHEESNQKKGNGNQAARVNLSAIAKQVLRDYNSDEESEQEEDNKKPVAIIRNHERSHSLESSVFSFEYSDTN